MKSKLNSYLEKLLKDSNYEKILVSKPLRKIKGKTIPYRMPWKKMVSKMPGTYTYIGEEEEKENVYRAGLIPYFIKDNKIYIALMKPSDPKYGGDSFQIAKGKQEEGEDLLDTAVREAYQELGITINKSDVKLLWNNKLSKIAYYFVNVEKEKSLNPKVNEEGKMETGDVGWFELEKAKEIIRDFQKPVLYILRRRIKLKGEEV